MRSPAGEFVNEPFVNFSVAENARAMRDALAQVATQLGSQGRYFITVMGFTDQTGDQAFNDRLSRARAEQVISYLVGSHDVPVYRIHMVGLGDQKLIDAGKGKEARAASRRVEITVYTAKPLSASATGGN